MTKEQMEAYLARINYQGTRELTEETLRDLIWLHLKTIPFENLEIFDGKTIPSLKLDDIYEKIIVRRRGGHCFELNRLFCGLLGGMGFSVYPVAVRILWNRKKLPPALHRGTIVELGKKKYFCDVGFGGPGPKGLIEISAGDKEVRGDVFRVVCNPDGSVGIDRMQEDAFTPIMLFEDRRAEEVDFDLMNFYCSKSEDVLFTRKRIVNLCLENGSLALTDRTLTMREGGRVETRVYDTDEALLVCLRDLFGICIQAL